MQCNGYVQFEPRHAGLRLNCPHCGVEIVLYIPAEVAAGKQTTLPPPHRARGPQPGNG